MNNIEIIPYNNTTNYSKDHSPFSNSKRQENQASLKEVERMEPIVISDSFISPIRRREIVSPRSRATVRGRQPRGIRKI